MSLECHQRVVHSYKVYDQNYSLKIIKKLSSQIIVLLCLLLSFSGLLLVYCNDNKNDLEKTYGVIVDCGSSGSRAHLFQWNSYLRYPELLNNVEAVRDSVNNQPLSMKIHPGLSSLMYNPEQSFEYLKPIIEFVSENVPEKSHKATSIYVLATAGMRLLDSETQLEIMNDLIEDFQSENSFASFKTSVISGSSEGMYQWITVNSLAKRFNVDSSNSKGNKSKENKSLNLLKDYYLNEYNSNEDEQEEEAKQSTRTLGLIEMGGASIQVTYQLTEEIESTIIENLEKQNNSLELVQAFQDQIVRPKISREAKDFKYKLVSTTFLGFGGNSVRLAYVDLLVNKYVVNAEQKNQITGLYTKSKPLVVKDACLPVGSSETVTRPARILTLDKQGKANNNRVHQTVGFNIEEDDITISVRVDGSGNYQECFDNLKEMLNRAKEEKLNCKKDQVCSMSLIGTEFVPFHEFEFLGLSDFYYTAKEMINLPGQFKQQLFLEKTKEICETPYKKLLVLYPNANKFDKSRVLRECFKATWIHIFLKYVVNLPDDYKHFETVGKINGDDIDWTLGAVLDNSLSMEMAAEAPKIEINLKKIKPAHRKGFGYRRPMPTPPPANINDDDDDDDDDEDDY